MPGSGVHCWPRARSTPTEFRFKQTQIPDIGLERDIEHEVQQRNQTNDPVDPKIDAHAKNGPLASLQTHRINDGVKTDERRRRVANHRKKTDDRVQTKPDRCAGKPVLPVHQIRERVRTNQSSVFLGLTRAGFRTHWRNRLWEICRFISSECASPE